LHLVHFNVVKRRAFMWDSATEPGSPNFDGTLTGPPQNDGIWLEPQAVVQHDGTIGQGFKVAFADGTAIDDYVLPGDLPQPSQFYEESDKDMVVALPGQVVTIRAKFDKPGRYVW